MSRARADSGVEAMGNRCNYRCPKCGSPDEIEIIALVSVRLTSTGSEGDAGRTLTGQAKGVYVVARWIKTSRP
jgi:hypothetical protein